MKVVTVSTDTKIFEKGRVFQRIKSYSKLDNIEKYFVLVFTKNKDHIEILEDNFIVIPIYVRYKIFAFLKLFFAIKKIKLENKNDIILSSQDPFEIGLFCFFISKILNYKLLVQVHTDISSKYFRTESFRNYLQYLISKFVIKRANSTRVVSAKIKYFLINKWRISEDKIFLAPIFAGDLIKLVNEELINRVEGGGEAAAQNEVESNPNSSTQIKIKTKENTLLIMSRLEKVKNIELAIKSFLLLTKDTKYSDFKLKIVGSGSQEKYLKEKWGKFDNIIFEKFTDKPFEEYKKTKIFLLSSWYEGWGMTPIESVSCGTPVVMTNVGCANEFIFNNLNGQIVETFNPKDFCTSIKNILENLENYGEDKLKNSLKILQTKDEYLNILLLSFLKCF